MRKEIFRLGGLTGFLQTTEPSRSARGAGSLKFLFILLAALSIALGTALVLRGFWLSRFPKRAYSYRRRYQQIVARIEFAVLKVNTLGNLVPHVKNARVLDEFESCLRMMETLLTALTRTPNFGFEPKTMDHLGPLMKRVEAKIDETYRKFKRSIEERPMFSGLLQRWQQETSLPAAGCYFCSRPYVKDYFKEASIRVDGIELRVQGCHICVAELKARKKVKVLYFQQEGRPVHWSLVDNYKPMEQYWDLNKRRPNYQTPEIECVE